MAKGKYTGGGSRKNIPNKTTVDIKNAFKQLVEGNLDNITSWMQKVAKENPAKALEFMHQFAQYNVPLLARTQITGADDKPLIPDKISEMTFEQLYQLKYGTKP